MALAPTVITVGTTSVALSGTDADGISGMSLQFTTPASPVVYAGPPGVTSATGYPLLASTEYTYDLQPGDIYHAVVAAGTASVQVLRIGV